MTAQFPVTVHEVSVAVAGVGQALPQLTFQPGAGVAVMVTGWPTAMATSPVVSQPSPQLTPPELSVTVPDPVLFLLTRTVYAVAAKEAVVQRSTSATSLHTGSGVAPTGCAHELDQLEKRAFVPGAAVNVTVAPFGTAARHTASHGAPSIVAATEPVPDVATVNFTVWRTNVAVTVPSAVADTTHADAEPAPAHRPPHDENTQFVAGAGVNVTEVPAGTADRHAALHALLPILATIEPELDAPRVYVKAVRTNVAVVDTSAFATCVHVSAAPADEHELLQPDNPAWWPGTAVNTTVAPRGTAPRHAASHGIPSTVADTEPAPDAFAVTFTV